MSLFYALLVIAGVTNYLPTRYGPAALCLAVAFLLEYLGSSKWSDWTPGCCPGLVGHPVAAGGGSLGRRSAFAPSHPRRERPRRIWFGSVGDHWGVVWQAASRNDSTACSVGPVAAVADLVRGRPFPYPDVAIPEGAVATLRSLIHRFAAPQRIDEAQRR